MNERIKKIRKELGLTLEKFGKRVGVTKVAISNIEKGNRNITDQMFKLVCREFNINEEWLKTGKGEMFKKSSLINFDDYIKQKGITDIEKEIIINYLELDIEVREKFIDMLKKSFSECEETVSPYTDKLNILDNNEEYEISSEYADMSIDEMKKKADILETMIEKRQALSVSKKQKENSLKNA